MRLSAEPLLQSKVNDVARVKNHRRSEAYDTGVIPLLDASDPAWIPSFVGIVAQLAERR